MAELVRAEDREHAAAVPQAVQQQSSVSERVGRRVAQLRGVGAVEERSGERRGDERQEEQHDVPRGPASVAAMPASHTLAATGPCRDGSQDR